MLTFFYYCARIIIDVDSHMGKRILLIQYVDSVDAILSIFLALYVGEILYYLICKGLVPAPHMATEKASVGMSLQFMFVTFWHCHPYFSFNFCYCSFSLIYYFMVYYGN